VIIAIKSKPKDGTKYNRYFPCLPPECTSEIVIIGILFPVKEIVIIGILSPVNAQ